MAMALRIVALSSTASTDAGVGDKWYLLARYSFLYVSGVFGDAERGGSVSTEFSRSQAQTRDEIAPTSGFAQFVK